MVDVVAVEGDEAVEDHRWTYSVGGVVEDVEHGAGVGGAVAEWLFGCNFHDTRARFVAGRVAVGYSTRCAAHAPTRVVRTKESLS